MTRSASAITSSIWSLLDMARVIRPCEHLLQLPHPLDRPVEHPDVCLQPDGDECGVVADDATAEDDHLGGRHARNSAEQDPRPPFAFSSAQAPICGASRPATSLIGASSGKRWSAVSTVS